MFVDLNLSPLYRVTSKVTFVVGWIFCHKLFKFFGCSGPYYEDVIYESFPSMDVIGCLVNYLCF